VGVAIWKLIDGRRSVREIADALREEFDQVPGRIDEDVAGFVESLVEFGFASPPPEEG
jgi:hypothetical protein